MTAPDQNKDVLRQLALARRRQIPEDDRARFSKEIEDKFLAHAPLPPPGSIISGYSAINAEVDVKNLLLRLIDMGYICTLPVVEDAEQRLAFLRWDENTPLRSSIYGIPEPLPGAAEEYIPDLLIMPLLAFDKLGNRVGYGSGNFDRTFAYIKKIKPFTTVAVAFESQQVETVPTNAYDYPMDMIVTEENIYDFRGSRS